ncbi:MAG: glycosyltransferase family 1 protein [Lachnospiraceae bacterium]|nr:glycosyltransferase family 1 protein [Lachnospiraceae bacterium]
MKPERILYINGGILDRGGITSYMMNYYRHFDRDLLQVDFVAHGGEGPADGEIRHLGGEIFHVPTKRESLTGNVRTLNRLFASGKYRLVHAHMDAMNGMVLKLAEKQGIPIRISHSHSTNLLTTNKLKILLHERVRKKIPRYATQLWACSNAAGQWLYGQDASFTVVPNAIDTERFCFRTEVREKIRTKLGLAGKHVVGHIGTLAYPKNQEFLIELFPEVLKKRPDAVLLLAGEGRSRTQLEAMIAERGLGQQIRFLGQRNDVQDLLSAFDVFAFPSLFEGFPVVMLEVQANGCPCVLSGNISNEVVLAGNVRKIPLQNKKEWIDTLSGTQTRESDGIRILKEKGYEISDAARVLQNTYLELLK